MSKAVRRLYEQFKPEHYELWLDPDRDAGTIRGRVTISGQKAGRPSQRLTFHQNGLKIKDATIIRHDKKGDQTYMPDRLNHHQGFDEIRLHTTHMMYPGRYTVMLQFEGTITHQMNGVYPCFFEHNGQKKSLLATQFESHHAREVFPCIDEPEAKATFQLSLVAPQAEVVLSNTLSAKVERHTDTKRQTVTFEKTPKMSTYLLAFVYGELSSLEAKTKDGVLVRTFATPEHTPHTQFALDIAVKTLEFFNDYFDIPYPLAKCDLIALPDFASGAMENWGCVTFREQAMIVDPKNTSLPAKQYVALVVAHELAHQWFGNLVTMRWWTDLWLNEGFASWIEYLAIDHIFPEWNLWTEFISTEQEAAFRLDALEHTHPIEVPIHHPDEIRTIFDTISYSKGSSVIHMLHQYLGPKAFQEGLQHYLKTHAYSNTDTVDLWTSLEKISEKPVKAFMEAWTNQPGFPVVHAELATNNPTLRQERFYLNASATKVSTTWPVPVLASESIGLEAFSNHESAIHTKKLASELVINEGRSGFYRTVYDTKHLESLATVIKDRKIAILDRLGLLSDAFETAKAGYGSSADALKLLETYTHEDNTFVWDIMAAGLGSIKATMHDETLREAMKPFGRALAAEQLARLGWQPKKDEPHSDTLLRPTILGLASASDDMQVVDEAMKQFHAIKDAEDVAPDIRGILYGTAARVGGTEEFEKMLQLHNASSNSEQRVTLSAALTGFRQPQLIKRALAQIDSKDVRLQDAAYWLAYSFSNRFARDAAWEWMTSHWEWLEKNLGNDLSFYRFPIYAARAYSDEAFLSTFKQFFEAHMSPAFERPVNQGCEIIQWQSAWRTRDLEAIKAYFQAKNTV